MVREGELTPHAPTRLASIYVHRSTDFRTLQVKLTDATSHAEQARAGLLRNITVVAESV